MRSQEVFKEVYAWTIVSQPKFVECSVSKSADKKKADEN